MDVLAGETLLVMPEDHPAGDREEEGGAPGQVGGAPEPDDRTTKEAAARDGEVPGRDDH